MGNIGNDRDDRGGIALTPPSIDDDETKLRRGRTPKSESRPRSPFLLQMPDASRPDVIVDTGLLMFGVAFAVISLLHPYLVLACAA